MTTIACLSEIQYIPAEILTSDVSTTNDKFTPPHWRVNWVTGVAFLGNYSVRSGIINRVKKTRISYPFRVSNIFSQFKGEVLPRDSHMILGFCTIRVIASYGVFAHYEEFSSDRFTEHPISAGAPPSGHSS